MEETKFNMSEIEKTFTNYKKNEIFDGVVVLKRDDGVIFNIGGKSDAFIEKQDFENFDNVKLGDRFKVAVLGTKTEDGMIKVSKKIADNVMIGSQNAEKLKIGSKMTFFATGIKDNCLVSKMGIYNIVVPNDEIDINLKNLHYYLNKQYEAIVTEIDKEKRLIVCSIKILKEQQKETIEATFWNSIFINKVVQGKVEKILTYGAFVSVDGISCFIHISDIAYEHIDKIEDYLKIGETYTFRVIKLDKQQKRVSLGLKQLVENPKTVFIKNLHIGDKLSGTVTKILAFGAIIKLDDSDVTGLLHVSDATQSNNKRIYQVVKLGQKVEVEIKSIDINRNRISFKL